MRIVNKMEKRRSIKKIVSNVLFYFITIFLLSYVVVNIVAPDKVVDVMMFKISSVPTNSMIPTIEPNDLIVQVKTNKDKIEKDDIIVFENYIQASADIDNDGTQEVVYVLSEVIHRVVEDPVLNNDGETTYVTKGDNPNNTIDIHYELADGVASGKTYYLNTELVVSELTQDQIKAAYLFRIPWVGTIPISIQSYLSTHNLDFKFIGLVLINLIVIVVLVKVIMKKPDEEKAEEALEDIKKEEPNDLE